MTTSATKTMDEQRIEIWYDETSNPDAPAWVVSLDTDSSTITLHVYDGYDDAYKIGEYEAKNRNVPFIRQSDGKTLWEPATT